MSIRTETVCNVCAAVKKETNHWWRGRITMKGKGILIFAAAAPVKRQPGDQDFCGREHANTWASQQMETITNAERSGHAVPAAIVD